MEEPTKTIIFKLFLKFIDSTKGLQSIELYNHKSKVRFINYFYTDLTNIKTVLGVVFGDNARKIIS